MIEETIQTLRDDYPVEEPTNRRGKARVSNVLLTPPFLDRLNQVFRCMRLQIENITILEDVSAIEVDGYSPRFDELADGEDVPNYLLEAYNDPADSPELVGINVTRTVLG